MIELRRINGKTLVINSDLIEHLEMNPDTVVSMMTGQKFMVLESATEVVRKVIAFRRSICGNLALVASSASSLRAPVMQPGEGPEQDED